MNESLRREIERSLSTLTPREADVIRLYFGLSGKHPMTLEEIGEKFDFPSNNDIIDRIQGNLKKFLK